MTRKDLIEIVDEVYPDGMVGLYFHEPYGCHGDTLASFVARKLCETFDEGATKEQQLTEAIRVLSTAARELQDVIDALVEQQEKP